MEEVMDQKKCFFRRNNFKISLKDVRVRLILYVTVVIASSLCISYMDKEVYSIAVSSDGERILFWEIASDRKEVQVETLYCYSAQGNLLWKRIMTSDETSGGSAAALSFEDGEEKLFVVFCYRTRVLMKFTLDGELISSTIVDDDVKISRNRYPGFKKRFDKRIYDAEEYVYTYDHCNVFRYFVLKERHTLTVTDKEGNKTFLWKSD